eukprot:750078-Pleurochrysis_carterae.AAC.3
MAYRALCGHATIPWESLRSPPHMLVSFTQLIYELVRRTSALLRAAAKCPKNLKELIKSVFC